MAKKKAAKTAASAAKAPKPRPTAKKAAKPKAAKPKAAASSGGASAERRQADQYAKAVAAFQAGKIKPALKLFEEVAEGPDSALRHRAHVHVQICRRRTESDTVKLTTADDLYNYAVKLINDRRLEEADQHLDKALKKASRAAHVHYAKAVVGALQRDVAHAYQSLSRAIELDPKHRLHARRDPDIAAVRDDEQIAQLLQGDAPVGDS